MKLLLVAVCSLLPMAAAPTQDDGLDLMTRDWAGSWRRLSLYAPKVAPQVTCIRTDREATTFAMAAWGEDRKELHVDFKNEQVLVAAWGAMRSDKSSEGAPNDLHCDGLLLTEDTLKVRLRTVLWPGPGIDVPLDSKQPGRTMYPSLFLAVPRTERVEVDVVGSRRRDPAKDFPTVGEKALEVRVHPDATPDRERISVLLPDDGVDQPRVTHDARVGEHVLDIAWGKLGPGAYRLEMIAASIRDGVLHATVRADNVPIMLYSGPGEHHPRLTLQLPPVRAVQLRIERVGVPLPEDTPDFVASQSKDLVVTVEDLTGHGARR
ncbi:MAG: hypothetical protein H6835_17385 [Planctomycetes bacterium]|nr:hypothetical protein [Planctomycetota bacterium]